MARVLLFMPSARDVKSFTVSSLIRLCMSVQGLEKFTVFNPQNCSNIARARHMALQMGLEGGFTHVLMIDDDMVFPPDALARLLKHDKDIIGVNYTTKTQNAQVWQTLDLKGQYLSSEGRKGIQEVMACGFGVMLIRLACLESLPIPHFETIWLANEKRYLGEDYYFCFKARSHDLKVHVDHDVSRETYHVGDYLYSGFGTMPERMVA